ncbi:2-oxoglutarate (2OG) and Fe(II)-dependent oxygenase superfamily protein [Actinidia rufa]|uniref:2-oxoglutarate (2OG) and Fe(II)-dependent oxygenase superfamily protein n=1 Tax=Actinidia rufa TaxID=165716 RepID=A0A7J0FUZ2_9ERIC|nr:2-oxoglutarate (2OG) and Fe(II)-dependent oxygenase superfamily protein [Actinidia rufa]
MSPSMVMVDETRKEEEDLYQKGVKHLSENGITKLPKKYVWPVSERPNNATKGEVPYTFKSNLNLPIIDFADLQGPNRSQVLKALANACEHYGFFQLVNHGIPCDVTSSMVDVGKRFFELPFEEREKYMTSNMYSPVRYGTSFNQTKDGVFSWRDFLKFMCHPLSDMLPHWPSSPLDFRKLVVTYVNETKYLFLMLMEAIIESLGLAITTTNITRQDDTDNILEELKDGSQLMVVNCYPPCPEPHLTLGMPPHSDYGFLTLLLQDEVEGLQIQLREKWFTVQPIPSSFVVNVGDHLEIFSNGRYKSVLHRAIVNSTRTRISVASLHSVPVTTTIRPWPKLTNEANPRRYMDTDFATFLKYASSSEPKKKNFLESRILI